MTTYKKCGKLNLINDNMMVRDRIESECRDLFKRYKMGTTIWSTLECGILTGKYINGITDDSR